jgi:hypothetical protein
MIAISDFDAKGAQGLKPVDDERFTARLKPVPDTNLMHDSDTRVV